MSVETNGRRCAGCAGAASAYPLQSWIFSQLILVIAIILPEELARASAHWALMFFILGIGAGVAYFSLGWSSTTISTVSSLPPVGNRFFMEI
jgi:ATP-binding cassette subfamily B (MDR/TAP) protein 1